MWRYPDLSTLTSINEKPFVNHVFKPDQRRARSERTRENILDAALYCYQDQGINDTAMEDVARQAGVGRATLYRHFSNQEALLMEVMTRNVEQLQQVMASSLKSSTQPEEYFV